MAKPTIVIDAAIPCAEDAFGTLGDVRLVPHRELTREVLADADMLLVRSVTPVRAGLLADTPVRFVGTCTAGHDHVDARWLREAGIAWAHAPGCNAQSVADYVVAALLELEAAGHLSVRGARFGIVGFGHVGRRVAHAAGALGMRPVVNDPPLAGATGEPLYRPLEELLDCEVIGLHCALEDDGPYPSRHLVNRALLERVRPGACLINVARGPVADGAALADALDAGILRAAVLDVWEQEPSPDPRLVDAAFIATPHIAGYAYDSKINATAQVYSAACRFLGMPPDWSLASATIPATAPPCIAAPGALDAPVHSVVRSAYDMLADSAACRAALQRDGEARAAAFEELRRNYPVRRTFSAFAVEAGATAGDAIETLRKLGFQIAATPVMEDAVDAP